MGKMELIFVCPLKNCPYSVEQRKLCRQKMRVFVNEEDGKWVANQSFCDSRPSQEKVFDILVQQGFRDMVFKLNIYPEEEKIKNKKVMENFRR